MLEVEPISPHGSKRPWGRKTYVVSQKNKRDRAMVNQSWISRIGSLRLPIVCHRCRYGLITGKDRNGHRRGHTVSQPLGRYRSLAVRPLPFLCCKMSEACSTNIPRCQGGKSFCGSLWDRTVTRISTRDKGFYTDDASNSSADAGSVQQLES